MATDKAPIIEFEFTIDTRDENDIVTGETNLSCRVYSIEPADRSVGIMSAGPGDMEVIDPYGKDVWDKLDDTTQDRITDRACELIHELGSEDYNDGN